MSFGGAAFGGASFGGDVPIVTAAGEPTDGLKLRNLSSATPDLRNVRGRQPALTVQATTPRVTNLSGE